MNHHQQVLAEIDTMIGDIARRTARHVVGKTMVHDLPEDMIEEVIDLAVAEAVRGFRQIVDGGVCEQDAHVAAEQFRYHLVRECASIARTMVYEGGTA